MLIHRLLPETKYDARVDVKREHRNDVTNVKIFLKVCAAYICFHHDQCHQLATDGAVKDVCC